MQTIVVEFQLRFKHGVVGRGDETQLQVGEKLKGFPQQIRGIGPFLF